MKYVRHIYIIFPDEYRTLLVDMYGKKRERWLFGIIGISISASIFIRDAFVIILFSLALNRVKLHIVLSLVLRQN